MAVSPGTLDFYRIKLGRFLYEVNADTATRQDIETFLLQFDNLGNRHAYHRAIKTFYNWRYETYDLPSPVKHLKAPRLEKLIMPSLTRNQVNDLLMMVDTVRDRAIIAMFTESGLRLSELVNICPRDIDWDNQTIRVLGKGRKEALAPLGKLTQKYLRELLEANTLGEVKNNISDREQDSDSRENLWHLNKWGDVPPLDDTRYNLIEGGTNGQKGIHSGTDYQQATGSGITATAGNYHRHSQQGNRSQQPHLLSLA